MGSLIGIGFRTGGRVQGGVEIQPMSQERLHGGGKQGRASVTGPPDSGGMHSLIGVIDTALPLRYVSVQPKRPFKIPIRRFQEAARSLAYTILSNRLRADAMR